MLVYQRLMWIETCTDNHWAYFDIHVLYLIYFGFMVSKELKYIGILTSFINTVKTVDFAK